jgi:hypothetical protein
MGFSLMPNFDQIICIFQVQSWSILVNLGQSWSIWFEAGNALWHNGSMTVLAPLALSKNFVASVAHRYWNPDWTPERNRQIYGRDAHIQGLGANLDVRVTAIGGEELSEDRITSALAVLKTSIDHQCLFEQNQAASTLERITQNLGQLLLQQAGSWSEIEVWESGGLACRWDLAQKFSLKIKILNLVLTLTGPVDDETGLIVPREITEAAVKRVFFATGDRVEPDLNRWGSGLFAALQRELPLLSELRIDLPRQEYLIFHNNV